MCKPTRVAATVPRTPKPTITPMMIRKVFKPLLVGGGGPEGIVLRAAAAGTAPAALAPHFLQKAAPGSSVAPQELQKATSHLAEALLTTDSRSITQVGVLSR